MDNQGDQKFFNRESDSESEVDLSRDAVGRPDKHELASIQITALPGLPLVHGGDDIATYIRASLDLAKIELRDGDILVIAQKIVSKAENRLVRLADVEPSNEAKDLAREMDRDPKIVELVLAESDEILRATDRAMIVSNHYGLVLANAGIDRSNVNDGGEDEECVLLLPKDPDGTCERLRQTFFDNLGIQIGVIINDSIGRAWRRGSVGLAIGAAGVPSLLDLKGRPDLFGRPLEVSEEAIADELAAAASLVQGQANEGRPVVLIQGYCMDGDELPARSLVRDKEQDLFR